MTIERLKKQVDELTVKNKEIGDELKHANDQLRQASSGVNQSQQQIQKKDSSQKASA